MGGRWVSILVFMDLALEVYVEVDIDRLPQFQSLFLWILLSKTERIARGHTRTGVSILVFMDLALEAEKAEPIPFAS